MPAAPDENASPEPASPEPAAPVPAAVPSPAPPWWKDGVVYQIYPRSFADSDGDGVGDLPGIRRHLEHLAWLGVDAVWISPFYRSPMRDYGYDVSDFCDVDPLFGSLADADALIAEAHALGLKVLVDWVPNHTSDQHPWFLDARSSPDAEHRSWYVWRDPGPAGELPNNWVAAFGSGPAWTLDEATNQLYLHCFLPEQPDLNWQEPAVVEAMHATLRFWLDRGVDGFRMDVIHLIGKDPELPDDPADLAELTHVPLNDRPETHELLRGIRGVLDSYDGDRTSVGEVYLLDTGRIATYYGDDDELHLSFNFVPLHTRFAAESWRKVVRTIEDELTPRGAWPTWVLSNHDNVRHRSRYGGSEARARAAAFLLLGLRGTPFLYAGEELGLEDAVIPPDRVLDPGGRDGCRAPIPWDATPSHGWPTADPWLPWPPDADDRNVASARDDRSSTLWLYRDLLAARRSSPALAHGDLELLDLGAVDDAILAWRRHDAASGDRRTVLVNFTDTPVVIPDGPDAPGAVGANGEGPARVLVASDRAGEGAPFTGTLAPTQAVILDA